MTAGRFALLLVVVTCVGGWVAYMFIGADPIYAAALTACAAVGGVLGSLIVAVAGVLLKVDR